MVMLNVDVDLELSDIMDWVDENDYDRKGLQRLRNHIDGYLNPPEELSKTLVNFGVEDFLREYIRFLYESADPNAFLGEMKIKEFLDKLND